MKYNIFFLFFVLFSVPSFAQNKDTMAKSDSLFALGVDLYKAKKFSEAIPLFEEGDRIDKAVLPETSNRRDYSSMWLASCYYMLGDTAKAISVNKEYYRIEPIDRRLTVVSDSLAAISETYFANNDFAKALPYIEKSAAIEKETLGSNSMWYGNTLYFGALCNKMIGDSLSALRYMGEYKEITKKNYGEEAIEYADACWEVLDLYNCFLYDEWKEPTLNNLMKIYDVYNSGKYIVDKTNLILLAKEMTELAELMPVESLETAIDLETKSLGLKKQVFDDCHIALAHSLAQLASFYSLLKENKKSIECAQNAIFICENLDLEQQITDELYVPNFFFQKDNKEFYMTLKCTLVEALYFDGNIKEGYDLSVKNLEICKKLLGTNSIEYIRCLMNVIEGKMGRMDNMEAAILTVETLKIMQNVITNTKNDTSVSDSKKRELCLMFLDSFRNVCNVVIDEIGYTEFVDTFIKHSITNFIEETSINILNEEMKNLYHAFYMQLLSDNLWKKGEISESIICEEEALRLYEKIPKDSNLSGVYRRLGGKYLYGNNLNKALYYLNKSKEIGKRNNSDTTNLYSLYYYLASAYGQNGNEKLAVKYITESNTILQQIVLQLFSNIEYSANRYSLWKKYEYAYNEILRIALKFNNLDLYKHAYNSVLFSKGLLLNVDMLFDNMVSQSGNSIIDVGDRKKSLASSYENWNASSTYDYIQMYTEDDNITIDKKQLQENLANLIILWHDVQNHLRSKETAVEFCNVNISQDSTMYMAFILTKDMKTPQLVPLFEEKQLNKLLLKESDTERQSFYVNKESAKLIWQPLKKYMEGAENIYFAPSGELYNLAIEYLPHWDEDCLMSEKWKMYRLSSTRELAIAKANTTIKKAIVYGGIKFDADEEVVVANSKKYKPRSFDIENVIADSMEMRDLAKDAMDLPATKIEAENVYSELMHMNVETQLRVDTIATEADVKDLSGRKMNLLHIATHGFYFKEEDLGLNDQTPLFSMFNDRPHYVEDRAMTRSGLLFAGAKKTLSGAHLPEGVDDGILTAQEISRLDLRDMNLVTLSACQTGQGELHGDGVFGLQRGFKKAGAKTLLVSLWKVDDEATQILMTSFYKNLTNGKSKVESLRLAQNTVRNYERDKVVSSSSNSGIMKTAKTPEQRKKEMQQRKDIVTITKEQPYKDPFYWAAFILLDGIN